MAEFRIFRGDADFDMMHVEHVRAVIKRSRGLLASSSTPDTFFGRKTQEPFPAEDPIERADTQNPIHIELQQPKKVDQ